MRKAKFVLLCVLVLGFWSCYNTSIDEINRPLGSELGVTWNLIENFHLGEEKFLSEFIIKNNSSKELSENNWELYMNFVHGRRILKTDSSQLEIIPINGDFHKIVPLKDFKGLAPGEEIKFKIVANAWEIKETNAPGGLFFVFNENESRSAPEMVTDYTIKPFTTELQKNRNGKDQIKCTPEAIYKKNLSIKKLPKEQFGKIIPRPISEEYGVETFDLNQNSSLYFEDSLRNEGNFLIGKLEKLLGSKISRSEKGLNNADIKLKIEKLKFASSPEAYSLNVKKNGGIEIIGNSNQGVFYGIQSLISILPIESFKKRTSNLKVPVAIVKDAPRFPYRGMMLDVARNFQTKESVKKLLDLLAFYKINKFHFHFTDDEGWRIEIKGLPELTSFGARRGFSEQENEGLYPGFGSGPFFNNGFGSGYYSTNDFVEILKYAAERHIEVIPEFELPGHARASVRSMEFRYEKLSKGGNLEEARKYLLSDLKDSSEYKSVQEYSDNVICPCQESTYNFIDYVVGQMILMYKEAGLELKNVHMGGDELPPGVWLQSPKCKNLIASNNDLQEIADLKVYFYKRVVDILGKYGLKTAVWEDALEHRKEENGESKMYPDKELAQFGVMGFSWNNFWGGGNEDFAYKLANLGYPMVLCGVTNLYFDMAYSKDPTEPGFYWGGFNDTRKGFEFVPMQIFNSAYTDMFGATIGKSITENREKLTEVGKRNIIGIQGNLFSETVKTRDQMEYMSFPKVLGLAERAWSPSPSWSTISDNQSRKNQLDLDWNVFANILSNRDLYRLNYIAEGVNFRIPPVGAKIENGQLLANVAYPYLTIRYTIDGSTPNKNSTMYSGPIQISGTIKLKAFDKIGRSGKETIIKNSNEI